MCAYVAHSTRCHPEPSRRPGEGPYETIKVEWSPAGSPRCPQRTDPRFAAGTQPSVIRSLTRLWRVRDDKPLAEVLFEWGSRILVVMYFKLAHPMLAPAIPIVIT